MLNFARANGDNVLQNNHFDGKSWAATYYRIFQGGVSKSGAGLFVKLALEMNILG